VYTIWANYKRFVWAIENIRAEFEQATIKLCFIPMALNDSFLKYSFAQMSLEVAFVNVKIPLLELETNTF